MASPHAAFVGSIPGNYDRYLGPLFFHDYADDLAARVPVTDGMRVLEVACGTGIVTTRLLQRLRGRGTLVATDLNEAMFAQGRQRLPAAEVDWRTADATSLPFPDGRFDAVVCQFGLMFFPDKARSIREAHRVLATGGRYLFNVWDGFERNPVQRITHETVATFFPDDPPQFYAVPCGFHDTGLIRSLLAGAGFAEIECHTVEKIGESPSAADAAIGLIEGNPILASILERRPDALGDIEKAVAARLASELGDHPLRSPLRALVFSAARA
jgi:SAM-dependent methyltransferase